MNTLLFFFREVLFQYLSNEFASDRLFFSNILEVIRDV